MSQNTPSLAGLSLRDLTYALTVSQTGHFGRAAELCGVSQPGLSEQIRKLEALLGCTLFERGRHGAHLTPRGRSLIPLIEQTLRNAQTLLEQARNAGTPLAGPLATGLIPTLAPYYVPSLLRALRTSHPEISLRLTEEKTETLESLLLSHSLDIIIAALPLAPGITAEPLFSEPFRLLVPENDPLATKSAVSENDIDPARLILLDPGNCLRDQTLSLCHLPAITAGTQPNPVATSIEMLRCMVEAGEGTAVMPALAVETARTSSLSHAIPFTTPAAARTIALGWRQTDPRHKEFRALAESLRKAADSLP